MGAPAVGVGLRPPHHAFVLEHDPGVDFLELPTETFLAAGGRRRQLVEALTARGRVALAGVELSIGSTDPLDAGYLDAVAELVERATPLWVADQLAWSSVGGVRAHAPLPLPWNERSLAHLVDRVRAAQAALGRPLALANVAAYTALAASTLPEAVFLRRLAEATGCAVIVDLAALEVSRRNLPLDALAWLAELPRGVVVALRLSGHADLVTHALHTRDAEVATAVWELYEAAVRRFGPLPTVIERDSRLPPFPELVAEAAQARAIGARAGDHD